MSYKKQSSKPKINYSDGIQQFNTDNNQAEKLQMLPLNIATNMPQPVPLYSMKEGDLYLLAILQAIHEAQLCSQKN